MLSRSAIAALFAVSSALACGTLLTTPGADPALVLTDTACADTGLGASASSHFKVMLVNKTADEMWVVLVRLREGRSYSELVAHIAAEQRRIQAREALAGPQISLIDSIQSRVVDAGSEQALEIDLTAGTYALVCDRATAQPAAGAPGRIAAIFVAGPFRVP